MSTNENKMSGLRELSGSNFEIADGEEDIRGWDVRNGEGKRLGDVDDLLFDEANQKIRYIIMDMDDNEVLLRSHKVLIPIGLAELDGKDDDVILKSLTIEQLESLAEYDKNMLDNGGNDLDTRILAPSDALENQDDLYASSQFDDSNLYRNRLETQNTEHEMPENPNNDEEVIHQSRPSGINLKSRVNLL